MKKIPQHYTRIGDIALDISSVEKRIGEPTATDCWPWIGGTHKQGYPMIGCLDYKTRYPKMVTGQRYLMTSLLGRAPRVGENGIRTCSNPACMNPAHLLIGTLSDRNKIMEQNGRAYHPTGPRGSYLRKQNRIYKYSEQDIIWARTADTQEIADKYGITKGKAASLRWAFQNGYKWIKGETK